VTGPQRSWQDPYIKRKGSCWRRNNNSNIRSPSLCRKDQLLCSSLWHAFQIKVTQSTTWGMNGVWSRLMGMLKRALKNKDYRRGEPPPPPPLSMATHKPVSVQLFLRRFVPLFRSEFWKPTALKRCRQHCWPFAGKSITKQLLVDAEDVFGLDWPILKVYTELATVNTDRRIGNLHVVHTQQLQFHTLLPWDEKIYRFLYLTNIPQSLTTFTVSKEAFQERFLQETSLHRT
jgi:hypothetical protein